MVKLPSNKSWLSCIFLPLDYTFEIHLWVCTRSRCSIGYGSDDFRPGLKKYSFSFIISSEKNFTFCFPLFHSVSQTHTSLSSEQEWERQNFFNGLCFAAIKINSCIKYPTCTLHRIYIVRTKSTTPPQLVY